MVIRKVDIIVLGIVLAAIGALGVYTYLYDNLSGAEEAGNRVLIALEKYKGRFGDYPRTLDQLVPEFLSDIPQPPWGMRRWIYGTSGGSFSLSVSENEFNYPEMFYSGVDDRWIIDM